VEGMNNKANAFITVHSLRKVCKNKTQCRVNRREFSQVFYQNLRIALYCVLHFKKKGSVGFCIPRILETMLKNPLYQKGSCLTEPFKVLYRTFLFF